MPVDQFLSELFVALQRIQTFSNEDIIRRLLEEQLAAIRRYSLEACSFEEYYELGADCEIAKIFGHQS
jgi:hypothetical protein